MSEYVVAQAAVLIVPTLGKPPNDFRSELERELASVRKKLEIEVQAQKSSIVKMKAQIAAAKKAAEATPINLKINNLGITKQITEIRHKYLDAARELRKGLMLNIKIAGLTLLPQLATGLAAVNSAMMELVHSAALLPGLFAGVAASISSVMTGVSGIKDAFREYSEAQKNSASEGLKARNAALNVQNAYRDLGRAIKDAQRNLEDLNAQLRDAPLDEAEAILRLQEARAEAADKYQKSGLQQQKDAIAVQRAENDLVNTRLRNSRLIQDVAEANAKGVQGADSVREATERLAKAQDDASTKAEKLIDSFKKLSPNAQAFVKAVQGMSKTWNDFQSSVQDRLFAGIDRDFTRFAQTTIPTLQRGLGSIADGLNANLKAAMNSVGSADNQGLLDRIFGNTADAQKNLTGAIDPLIDALTRLSAVGTDYLPRLADGLTEVMKRFDNFVSRVDRSGELDDWIENGIDAFNDIGNSLLNLGSILDSIHEAFTGQGGQGLFDIIDESTANLAEFLRSAQGQNRLTDFFTKGREQLELWSPVLQDLPELIENVTDAAQDWAELLMPFLRTASAALANHPLLVKAIFSAYLAWNGIRPIIKGVSGGIDALQKAVVYLAGEMDATGKRVDSGFKKKMSGLATFMGSGGGLMLALGGVAAFLTTNLVNAHDEAADAAQRQKAQLDELTTSLNDATGAATAYTNADIAKRFREGQNTATGKTMPNLLQQVDPAKQNAFINAVASGNTDAALAMLPPGATPQLVEQTDFWKEYGKAFSDNGVNADVVAKALNGDPDAIKQYETALDKVNWGALAGKVPSVITRALETSGIGGNSPDLLDVRKQLPADAQLAAEARGKTVDVAGDITSSGADIRQDSVASQGRVRLRPDNPFGPLGVVTQADGGQVYLNPDGSGATMVTTVEPSGALKAQLDELSVTIEKAGNRFIIMLPPEAANKFTEKYASGGLINGPGTGTSDSIMARLSSGEYVVNARSTRKHLPLLEQINSGRVLGYSVGGTVGGNLAPGGGSADVSPPSFWQQAGSLLGGFATQASTAISNFTTPSWLLGKAGIDVPDVSMPEWAKTGFNAAYSMGNPSASAGSLVSSALGLPSFSVADMSLRDAVDLPAYPDLVKEGKNLASDASLREKGASLIAMGTVLPFGKVGKLGKAADKTAIKAADEAASGGQWWQDIPENPDSPFRGPTRRAPDLNDITQRKAQNAVQDYLAWYLRPEDSRPLTDWTQFAKPEPVQASLVPDWVGETSDPLTGAVIRDKPTPTILYEGAYGWADDASFSAGLLDELAKFGVGAMPYNGYALQLYPLDNFSDRWSIYESAMTGEKPPGFSVGGMVFPLSPANPAPPTPTPGILDVATLGAASRGPVMTGPMQTSLRLGATGVGTSGSGTAVTPPAESAFEAWKQGRADISWTPLKNAVKAGLGLPAPGYGETGITLPVNKPKIVENPFGPEGIGSGNYGGMQRFPASRRVPVPQPREGVQPYMDAYLSLLGDNVTLPPPPPPGEGEVPFPGVDSAPTPSTPPKPTPPAPSKSPTPPSSGGNKPAIPPYRTGAGGGFYDPVTGALVQGPNLNPSNPYAPLSEGGGTPHSGSGAAPGSTTDPTTTTHGAGSGPASAGPGNNPAPSYIPPPVASGATQNLQQVTGLPTTTIQQGLSYPVVGPMLAQVAYEGLPRGTNIPYGAPGFPDWVYTVGNQWGVSASTYAGHQEGGGTNKGIDWIPTGINSESPEGAAILTNFAKHLAATGQVEQLIYENPFTGERIGVANGRLVGPGTDQPQYYANDWGNHRNHIHTRTSFSFPTSPSNMPMAMTPAGVPLPQLTYGQDGGQGADGKGVTPESWMKYVSESWSNIMENLAKNAGQIAIKFIGSFFGLDLSPILDTTNSIISGVGEADKAMKGEGGGGSQDGQSANPDVASIMGNLSGLPPEYQQQFLLAQQAAGQQQQYNAAGGAEQWRPVVRKVLQERAAIYGITNLKAWEDDIIGQIQFESGGDPGAANLNDSNGRGGTQQVFGLGQFLPETFASHNVSGGSINDPVAQIYAMVDYLASSRYGVVPGGGVNWRGNGWRNGKGYATGGMVPPSQSFEPIDPIDWIDTYNGGKEIGPGILYPAVRPFVGNSGEVHYSDPFNNADGGKISGPGTGRSDSILARVSNGEYIVKAPMAAKHYGLLEAINSNRLPGFNQGGMLWPTPAPPPVAPVPPPVPAPAPAPAPAPPAPAPVAPAAPDATAPPNAPVPGAPVDPAAPRDAALEGVPSAPEAPKKPEDVALEALGQLGSAMGTAGGGTSAPGADAPAGGDPTGDPRAALMGAPTNLDHNKPAVAAGIQSAAGVISSAIGSAMSAASMAANGAAPGAGQAMGAAQGAIQGVVQAATGAVTGAVNILSSLGVGTVTPTTSTAGAYGAPLTREGMGQGMYQGPQVVNNWNGGVHTSNNDEFYKIQQRRELQSASPFLPNR